MSMKSSPKILCLFLWIRVPLCVEINQNWKRLRKDFAPQLLDIDGDSCHHVHNACKTTAAPFENWIENLCNNLHNDFTWPSKHKEQLRNICEIHGISLTAPPRCP